MSAHVRYGYIPSPVVLCSRPVVRNVVVASAAGFGAGLMIGWVLGR